jgi:hypothetical protein
MFDAPTFPFPPLDASAFPFSTPIFVYRGGIASPADVVEKFRDAVDFRDWVKQQMREVGYGKDQAETLAKLCFVLDVISEAAERTLPPNLGPSVSRAARISAYVVGARNTTADQALLARARYYALEVTLLNLNRMNWGFGPWRERTTNEPLLMRKVSREEAGQPRPQMKEKSKKKSHTRGEGREKLIAALTKHHQYANGGCLNLTPIGNNELARMADVAVSTASAFFEKELGGYTKYRVLCRDAGSLAVALKLLNNEFSPRHLLGDATADLASND